jgi:hypothetical protein
MSGEGIAAIILAGGTVAGQIATIVLQFMQRKITKANSDKLDDVHQATTSIAENTGTHRSLDGSP